jgi:phage-related protein
MADAKPLVWLHGEIKTPPFSRLARIEAGFLLRRLQDGEALSMPSSRRMPTIGQNCHELRVNDGDVTWRILYHVASDAVVILEVFQKRTRATPKHIITVAQKRLRHYQQLAREIRS